MASYEKNIAKKEKVLQNFVINGNKILCQKSPVQGPRKNHSKEYFCLSNKKGHEENIDSKLSKYELKKIKSHKKKVVNEQPSHLQIKSVIRRQRLLSAQQKENEGKKEAAKYHFYSKTLSRELFEVIWNNFSAAFHQTGQQLSPTLSSSIFEEDLDVQYGLLVEENQLQDEDLNRMVPSGIAFWQSDFESNRKNRVILRKLFLLYPTIEKLVFFITRVREVVFSRGMEEILYYHEHEKVGGEFQKPDKALTDCLRQSGWKWKMVLNLQNVRYTVFSALNQHMSAVDSHFQLLMANLISYQQAVSMSNSKRVAKVNYFDNFTKICKDKFRKANQLPQSSGPLQEVEIPCQESIIREDQQLQEDMDEFFGQIELPLKEFFFQTEQQKESRLYKISLQLDFKCNVTRKQLLFNKEVKMTRFKVFHKEERRPIYYLDTQEAEVKVVVSKWENQFQEQHFMKEFVTDNCINLDKIEIKQENKAFLWLPNFVVREEFNQVTSKNSYFDSLKKFQQTFYRLEFEPVENCIQAVSSKTDYKIKSDFMFGICRADLKKMKFVPLVYFKVCRKNFV